MNEPLVMLLCVSESFQEEKVECIEQTVCVNMTILKRERETQTEMLYCQDVLSH